MQSECYFSEYCREENKNHNWLDVQNDQWLEEMGDMIEAAVKSLKKEQTFYSGSDGRSAAA